MEEAGRPSPHDFEAAGLYDPAAADAPGRLALLEYLVDLGATMRDFAVLRPGEPLPVLGTLLALFPERAYLTLDDVAELTGAARDDLRMIWRAAGFTDPAPGEPMLFSAETQMLEVLTAGVDIFGADAVLQFVRVLGAAAARIAAAAVSMFSVTTIPDSLERDPTGLDLARANYEAASLLPGGIAAFDLLLRHHVHAARQYDDVVVDGASVVPRTIGFVDLVGSTALSTALTPAALSSALAEFESTAGDVITQHGGRLVKLIGDEVMFVADNAPSAVGIASALVDAFAAHDVLPPVRAGVASGDVVARDGDYSGAVVNIAARAVKIARPGEVLVSAATCDAVVPAGMACEPAGDFSLKGFDERVPLFRVRPE